LITETGAGAYRVLVKEPETEYLGDTGVDGKIILI
jgi:hypothetical protein